MKTKITYLIPLAISMGVAMVACSQQEPSVEGEGDVSNAIRFAAATESTRAGDLTTNNLKTFNVYAYSETEGDSVPSLFMDNVQVSKTGTNTWTYSPVKYWPAQATVDFYAFAPASWVGSSSPLGAVAYDAYPGTEDIIYAVNANLSGNNNAANAQVMFNFRHALSKVTVKMSSSNAGLTVKVSNVALANICTKGNFHFPKETTSGAPTATNVGRWSDWNTPVPYLLHMSQSPADQIILDTTPTDMGDTGMGMGGAKFMLPQPLSYRSGGNGNDMYITVMCSVYDSATGDKLWPNSNTPAENIVEGSTFGDGLLKFPLSTTSFSEWAPGNHYVYNLVINSNEEMGAIEFGTPTVDTFVEVTTNYQ